VYTDYISKLDKRELKSTMEKKFEQRFQLPLLAAVVLLLIEPLIGSRRRTRVARLVRWRRRSPA
jgi:hypothetical protein